MPSLSRTSPPETAHAKHVACFLCRGRTRQHDTPVLDGPMLIPLDICRQHSYALRPLVSLSTPLFRRSGPTTFSPPVDLLSTHPSVHLVPLDVPPPNPPSPLPLAPARLPPHPLSPPPLFLHPLPHPPPNSARPRPRPQFNSSFITSAIPPLEHLPWLLACPSPSCPWNEHDDMGMLRP